VRAHFENILTRRLVPGGRLPSKKRYSRISWRFAAQADTAARPSHLSPDPRANVPMTARRSESKASLRGPVPVGTTTISKRTQPTRPAQLNISAAAAIDADAKKPKFIPVSPLPPRAFEPTEEAGLVPKDANVLLIKKQWLDLILQGFKTAEIRGSRCLKERGTRIYIAETGTRGTVKGHVTFEGCRGPLSADEWKAMTDQHCVSGDNPAYGTRTYAWILSNPVRYHEGVLTEQPRGAVIWYFAN
jgi:hypothetical protein